jgi:hypothetical protein
MKTINWNEYEFRASQCYKLMVGALPNKNEFDALIQDKSIEKQTLVNKSGNKVKWTLTKQQELDKLIEKKNTPYYQLLPKTMTSELRKIHRAEIFGRNFSITNKYIEKGLAKEEEAISIYQKYRKDFKGINGFFINNKVRLSNGFVTGEADLTDTNDFNNCNEGFDTKCSWELETFPFADDKLDDNYFYQNHAYIWLSGAEKWTTVCVLVNCTEELLLREKLKYFYSLSQPMNEDDKNYQTYIDKCKELEKRLIFDYDAFIKENPGHQMEISRSEWHENNWDIPLKNRVVEKTVYRDESVLDDMKERILVAREYLNYLDKQL